MTALGAQRFLTLPANELPSEKCTQPPSAPGSLSLSPQQSSITVRWSAPADLGGRRDLYYQVEISDPDNLGSFTGTVFLSGSTTSRTISGLRPHTQYCVRVTSHNGVSDQDPDGEHLRTEGECTTTSEARPGVVNGVQGTYPYVVWNPPEEPNGVITGYRLVFSRSGTSTTSTVTTTNDQTFYIIQSSDIPWTSGKFRVTVAAGNSVGFGPQSSTSPLIIDGDSCPTTNCLAQSVGLVRYPATLASTSGPVTVTTQCADNAHVRTGFSLSVRCSSTGSWTGTTPQCECDTGYRAVTVSGRQTCQSLNTCPARNVGLVDYPTTQAPASGSVAVTTQCADNAHVRTGFSLSVRCSSSSSWTGTTPQCECDTGYRAVTVSGRQICQTEETTCPPTTGVTCAVRTVGLVRYPTTLAPASGSVTVATQCADNAHIRTGFSLNVRCSSSGSWTGTTPQCECDTGYRAVTVSGRQTCQSLNTCPARNVGLVDYPTTQAPASGSVAVTTQCADNAHARTGFSLSVRCSSSSSWTGTTPQCECDTGYRAVTVSGRQICQTEETTCPPTTGVT
ncbi:Ephrin type-B receptor 3 (Fragment), partial [Geodia barretti]